MNFFKLILLAITFIIPFNLKAQFDLDSLQNKLKETHINVFNDENNILYFDEYLDKDSLVRYHFVTDKYHKIGERSIYGICLMVYEYDDAKNQIEQRNYNKYGILDIPIGDNDWPAIIKWQYDLNNNQISMEFYKNETELISRIERDYDERHNVIEERSLDKNKELPLKGIAKTKYEYKNDDKVKIVSDYNKNNRLILRRKVAYTYIEYLSDKRSDYKEIRYYDKNYELVNQKYNTDKEKYAYKRYTYYPEVNQEVIEKYDKKGRIVDIEERYFNGFD